MIGASLCDTRPLRKDLDAIWPPVADWAPLCKSVKEGCARASNTAWLRRDMAYMKKVLAGGLSIAFPKDADVLHHHDYDLAGLWGRCRNEGLALRELGCEYTARDLIQDLAGREKFVQWLREIRHGRLRSPAALAFPILRPVAVYTGSRSTRGYRPYVHRVGEAT